MGAGMASISQREPKGGNVDDKSMVIEWVARYGDDPYRYALEKRW